MTEDIHRLYIEIRELNKRVNLLETTLDNLEEDLNNVAKVAYDARSRVAELERKKKFPEGFDYDDS